MSTNWERYVLAMLAHVRDGGHRETIEGKEELPDGHPEKTRWVAMTFDAQVDAAIGYANELCDAETKYLQGDE